MTTREEAKNAKPLSAVVGFRQGGELRTTRVPKVSSPRLQRQEGDRRPTRLPAACFPRVGERRIQRILISLSAFSSAESFR